MKNIIVNLNFTIKLVLQHIYIFAGADIKMFVNVMAYLVKTKYFDHFFNDFQIPSQILDFLIKTVQKIAPGSSLGGVRPKANIVDQQGDLWIAKFPSRNDTKDMGAWESYGVE